MFQKGHICSEETRRKISDTKKKQKRPAWNKGKPSPLRGKPSGRKGLQSPLKGRTSPLKGRPSGRKGKRLNKPIWNKGIPASEEHKRKNSEAQCGEKHYNWRGGISFLPYCKKFNRKLKKAVKARDNHTCQLCGATDKKLAVHHVHYDKENCYPDLITICHHPCNITVNFNRKHYEKLFMNKLNDKGLLFWTKFRNNLVI